MGTTAEIQENEDIQSKKKRFHGKKVGEETKIASRERLTLQEK